MELTELVAGLRRPAAYPHSADGLEVHRTHISVVFLAGEFAYKIKKPVELEFLDYGTLERRRHFCEEEVRLNRRLAPEVYLGVAPIVESEGAPAIALEGAPDEEVLEWAVRMRRLPDDRTLEALLERDGVDGADLERLADHLAGFHAGAASGPEVARYGRFEVVARNARDNFTQSEEHVGRTVHEDVFRRAREHTETALEEHRSLIEARAERGVPRDTHGDLRLDHVYFLPGRETPLLIDCIEFNPAFRFADPVADMAFLAMDLRMAGRRELADRFADAYFRASGDEEGRRLLDFYVAYRAAVRGKVQGIAADTEDVPEEEREVAAAVATGHWLLALGALAPPDERPGLVLVGGLPGTGKSTLARELSRTSGLEVIRSDAVRKELAGLDPEVSADSDWGEGLYTSEWSARTYETCLRRAEGRLFAGGRVIVDASFHGADRRRAFVEAGVRLGVPVLFLVCEADREVARGRLEDREGGVSDAGPEIHAEMEERWEPSGAGVDRVTRPIPTGGEIEAAVRQARSVLGEAGLA